MGESNNRSGSRFYTFFVLCIVCYAKWEWHSRPCLV